MFLVRYGVHFRMPCPGDASEFLDKLDRISFMNLFYSAGGGYAEFQVYENQVERLESIKAPPGCSLTRL